MTALMPHPADSGTACLDFEEFYRDYRRKIARTLALSVGDHDLGYEATDEAMSRAYQRWGDLSACRNPQGWVFRTGRNWAISALRRRSVGRAKSQLVAGAVERHDVCCDPDLEEAVARLGEDHRSVIELRFYRDLSVSQVAQELGIPTGTVKSRLSRAIGALERDMGSDPRPA